MRTWPFICLTMAFLSCKADMKTYEWLPSECAPMGFPVEILSGKFVSSDGDTQYIPDGIPVDNGWGKEGSVHVVGEERKPIPQRLDITWFSFREDRFYAGSFVLPQDRIAALFDEGFVSPLTGERITYNILLVGLAPGGGVALWAMGPQVITEIAFLQAEEADVPWTDLIDNEDYPRERYVGMVLERSLGPDFETKINAAGIPSDLWSVRYRTKYRWYPSVITASSVIDVLVSYFNGEREYLGRGADEAFARAGRPVPSGMEVRWVSSEKTRFAAEVAFDEEEIFAAFAKLAQGSDRPPLELHVTISDLDASLGVSLADDQFTLALRKCRVRVFRP